MKALKALFVLLFVLAISVVATSAQDTTNDNNPATDPNANACREGGSMEGRCDGDSNGDGEVTEDEVTWSWTCGWYLIRFENNLLPASGVPSDCGILLSYYPEAHCFFNELWYSGVSGGDDNDLFFLWVSGNPGCWGDNLALSVDELVGYPTTLIEAATVSEAYELCKAVYDTSYVGLGYVDGSVWLCVDLS